MTLSGQFLTTSTNRHRLCGSGVSVTYPADRSRFPLTAYQRDVWASAALTPDAPNYVTAITAQLVGDVDPDVIAQCIARVWERNDGLRLQFETSNGVPYQALAETMPRIEWWDVTAAADPARAAQRLVTAAVDTPIDLSVGVPLRITMIRDGASSLRMLLRSHHVAMDATGLFTFAAAWLAEYESLTATGRQADLPATSFIDCLGSERAYRGSKQWGRDRDCLIDNLRDATPALFDRSGSGAARSTMRQHHAWLDRSLLNRLRERDILFFPYLCAIVGTYLTRVLRTGEVTLGIPLTNRKNAVEAATVGGHFANILPLRVDVGAQRPLAELVADLRTGVAQRIARQRLSLGDLMRELRRAGLPSGPLFDVTVNYLRLPGAGELAGFVRGVKDLSRGSGQLTLAINVHELDHDGPLELVFDYAADVFDVDYPIESVEHHLKTLLYAGVEDLEANPTALPMLPGDEHDVLTDRRRETAVPFCDRSTVIDCVMAQTARTPDAVAIIGPGTETVTYGQLAERTVRLANLLRRQGVGVGDHVAVQVKRGPDLVVAVLAAMHAGAAYVPIDQSYPAERIRYLLEDSAAKVVLTGGAGDPEFGDVPTITAGSWAGSPPLVAAPTPTATDAAYVIYTSGSTGRPKGVVVEHCSVINRMAWMQRRYPLGADDVILQKTPMSFDVSVWELFWWAIEGAKVALLAPGAEKDPREILREIAESRVTVMHFVPSMLTPFLDQLEAAPEAVDQADSLRVVFCSGEPLRPHQVMRWNRAFAGRGETAPRLVNLYGPTEATVDVSFYDCPTAPDQPVHRVPIGRPIDNIRLYVLGPSGQVQPTGVAGELCIAGVGVARGYLNRPELQAVKFVSDPFHEGDRMYRTGDLARRLADGQIEYLGRIDRQVKIRGNRVELGEVENVLVSAPGIADAMVVDTEKPGRGTYLIAYYVAPEQLATAELRKHLSQSLPDFMIPASFQRVDEIPLTPNGKADRAKLTAGCEESVDARWCAPRTDVESILAGVWRDVLDVAAVSVHDNFFDLGGDSILTLRVRALAEERGLILDTRDIAAHPTVAELADHVVIGSDGSAPVEPFDLVAGVDRPRLGQFRDAYPLTRLQLGMVFHSSERLDSVTYHDVFRYSLQMPWNERAFRTALDRLVARHPALRTAFDLGKFSEPLQLVYPRIEVPVDILDLRAATPDDAQSTLDEHISHRRRDRYQLDRPGLYRFGVFILNDRIDLVFAFHHAILDGWSVATIVTELLQEYRHFDGDPARAINEPSAPSFAEYVRAEQLSINDPADLAYWTQLLADAPPVQISGIRPHARRCHSVAISRVQRTLDVPAPLVDHVVRLAGAEHVPVKAVLLAAHLLTVGLFAAERDVTSGVVTHGRPDRAHADRIAGLFLNVVPIRVDTTGRTWRDVVHAVFEQDCASASHQRFPLFEIQRRLDIAFDVAFNYANFHAAGATLRAIDVELLNVGIHEDTNFALLVNVFRNPVDGTTTLRIDGDPALYTADQLDQIGHTYLTLLQRITTTPAEPVTFTTHTPTLSPSITDHTSSTVIDVFRDVVARRHGDTALQFGSCTVTYEELDQMAHRIAAGLLARGTRPGDRIALAIDRCPELIATVLGIAMAGAACVPLDVTYPTARLSAMLAQAEPAAVIVDSANESLIEQQCPRIGLADLLATAPARPSTLPVVDPQHAAYVLFTSGSTGTPKGVVMPHRALANLIAWQLSIPSGWLADAGRAPSTLQFAPLSFDVAFQEIYSTLCGGGRLILLAAQERHELPALLRTLEDTHTERVILPYVALQALADIVVRRGTVPSQLRIIASSGEQLRITDEIRQLCAAIDGVVLENQYGPTETHVVTTFTMTGDPQQFPALPPIGRPIDNVEVLLLDQQGMPVPDGAPGEIHIAGIALADGYHRRPDLTDEVFGSHPMYPGVRLYRTGDIGRRMPDGALVTDGRRGNQVKVRGHRVEPMEVELVLRKAAAPYAGITEMAVIARSSSDGSSAGTQLVAFLVGDADEDVEGAIFASLRDVLPDYMIPARTEWLAALPRTASGKRADRELAAMPLRTRTVNHVAPRDEHEAVIAELVADVLGVSHVGVFDEFSSMGGDSLSAVRLIVAIEQRYGLSIPVSSLLTGPTVAALAERVRDRVAVEFDPCVPIKPTGSRPPLFLVHPIGGTVLCYVELSKHLPPEQPLYGLQAAGIEPGTTASQSISEMARSYVVAIRRVQPHGPYHIGGWSLGGVIAFEMARQLEAQGQEAGSVLLLDSAALGGGVAAELPVELLYESFMWELLSAKRGADAPVEHLPDGFDSADEVLDFILGRAVEHRVLPSGSKEMVRRLFEVFRSAMLAVERYRPQACDCAVVLFRAADPLPEVVRPAHDHVGSLYDENANGWDRYVTGDLTVIEAPGNHLTMVKKPYAAVLATHLGDLLAGSQLKASVG